MCAQRLPAFKRHERIIGFRGGPRRAWWGTGFCAVIHCSSCGLVPSRHTKSPIFINPNFSRVAAAAAAPSASVRTMAGIPNVQERWSQRADKVGLQGAGQQAGIV